MAAARKRGKLKNAITSRYGIVAILSYAAVAAVYAAVTDGVLRDDAYIFFTYARNLAETGVLSFNAGEQSFGVTSIGWTLMLAFFSLFTSKIVVVAKILGVILGAFGAFFWARWIFHQSKLEFSVGPVALAALIPTVGAGRMVMGMEVAAVCFFSGLLVNVLPAKRDSGVWISGLLAGILFLVRPEMILVVLVVIVWFALKRRFVRALEFLVWAFIVSAWWPIWLFIETGRWLPPTRVGKMSVFLPESIGVTYPEFTDGSLIDRIQWAFEGLTLFAASSVSSLVFLLLIAGTILAICYAWWRTSFTRVRALTVPVIFTLVLLGMYCWMFPLLQLRYFAWLAPALVISLLAALKMGLPKRMYSTLQWAAIAGGLLLFIPALNHRAQSVQVQELRGKVGRVINDVTPPDARIALEPIGEVGFYADRYIVDLGGLINTDIQKYIINGYQDVDRMWECLVDYQADYLVTYDHDGFMGRLPAAYPHRFDLVTSIQSDFSYVQVRYRLLRIRR